LSRPLLADENPRIQKDSLESKESLVNTEPHGFLPCDSFNSLDRGFPKRMPATLFPETPQSLHLEANRCLFCHDAPCVKACPTAIDVPLFIRQIATQNLTGAAQTILEQNALGFSCGKVCPTEMLCQGACVFAPDEKPIAIGALQAYAVEQAWATPEKLRWPRQKLLELTNDPNRAQTLGQNPVAIVGAGPAGLAAACELALAGVQVTIYEAKPNPGGLSTYGVYPDKLRAEDAIAEATFLAKHCGFTLELNTPVWGNDVSGSMSQGVSLQSLLQNYAAVLLAVGLGDTEVPYPFESHLSHPNVWRATRLMEALRTGVLGPKPEWSEHRVVILGAGNSGLDAACWLKEQGVAQVEVWLRGASSNIRAYPSTHQKAQRLGVLFSANTQLQGLQEDSTSSTLRLEKKNLATQTHSLELVNGLIFATGQPQRYGWFCQVEGLALDETGAPQRLDAFGATSIANLYVAGDCVNGGKEAVHAVAMGRDWARHWLRQRLADHLSAV
jgi:dihydropyrimidine dehydrogenase (NAD+) subunit PreT